MSKKYPTYKYRLFGITVESEMEFPGLIPDTANVPDVTIKTGEVPASLPSILGYGALFQSAPDDFLLNLEKIGAFRVQNGQTITIRPLKESTSGEIRIFLFGSVMAALLHQRKTLPIHASTVTDGKGAFLISGSSSAGKSSLSKALINRGYKLISDDLSVVSPISDHTFQVQPGIPHLRLWKDTLNYFDIDGNTTKIRPGIEKYSLAVPDEFCSEPKTIQCIIILSTLNKNEFSYRELTGAEKFNYVKNNTYRHQYIQGLGVIESHFRNLSSLLREIKVFLIERPMSPLLIEELSNYVEDQILINYK